LDIVNLSTLGTELAGSGLVGFLVGFGVKKISRILAIVASIVAAIIFIPMAYLANIGIIEIHYDRLTILLTSIGNTLSLWLSSTGGTVLAMLGQMPVLGGFGAGVLLGWSRG
jgi:uncharacterized membrane protein (Fun14 family)